MILLDGKYRSWCGAGHDQTCGAVEKNAPAGPAGKRQIQILQWRKNGGKEERERIEAEKNRCGNGLPAAPAGLSCMVSCGAWAEEPPLAQPMANKNTP